MNLPDVFRFPHIGWIFLHLIAIPLVFTFGYLVCAWQFGAAASP